MCFVRTKVYYAKLKEQGVEKSVPMYFIAVVTMAKKHGICPSEVGPERVSKQEFLACLQTLHDAYTRKLELQSLSDAKKVKKLDLANALIDKEDGAVQDLTKDEEKVREIIERAKLVCEMVNKKRDIVMCNKYSEEPILEDNKIVRKAIAYGETNRKLVHSNAHLMSVHGRGGAPLSSTTKKREILLREIMFYDVKSVEDVRKELEKLRKDVVRLGYLLGALTVRMMDGTTHTSAFFVEGKIQSLIREWGCTDSEDNVHHYGVVSKKFKRASVGLVVVVDALEAVRSGKCYFMPTYPSFFRKRVIKNHPEMADAKCWSSKMDAKVIANALKKTPASADGEAKSSKKKDGTEANKRPSVHPFFLPMKKKKNS